MKLKNLKIVGRHKNFHNLEIDFSNCKGVAAFIGNNGSGKSNILEIFSAVFKALYLDEKDEFAYFLEYETFNNVSVKITSNGKGRVFAVNGNPVFDIKEYLPKRVIAIYSGEEDRLWRKYYRPVYMNYIAGVNQSNVLEYPKMFYLNKFYWNIILLSLLVSEADDVKEFVEEKLGIINVNEIRFKFFKDRYKNYNNSPALSFIKQIDSVDSYSLESFKTALGGDFSSEDYNSDDYFTGYDSTDVFQALYIAFTPEDKKIIDDIEITFNDDLNVSSLSEGQKKMLLIKATLEFASSEDTLILLDEPDAHIHINNKEQVVKVFEPYENNRQIIITTHSPTLTQSFKDENVFMLTNGELIKKDRQFIINELTKDFWNKQEQNYFLSQEKDTILVEGKTDIFHIETALDKLKTVDEKYKNLNFKFLPFNGASGLKLFVDEFPVNRNTKTFAFLDRDQAGFEAVKETLNFKGTKDEFKGDEKNNIYINYIPKKEGHTKSDFIIEDYYPLNKYKDFLFENVSCVTEMPNHSSSRFKIKFADKTKDFEVSDFEGFKKLFDLILEIKNLNKSVITPIVTPPVSPQNEAVKQEETNVEKTDKEEVSDEIKKPSSNFVNLKHKKSGIAITESQHLRNKPAFVKRMYTLLKEEILEKDSSIVIDSKVEYIAFKRNKKNIFDIKIQDKKIILWVNKKKGTFPPDLSNLFIDCSNKGHHGNGDYELHFISQAEVDQIKKENVIEKILKL